MEHNVPLSLPLVVYYTYFPGLAVDLPSKGNGSYIYGRREEEDRLKRTFGRSRGSRSNLRETAHGILVGDDKTGLVKSL